MKARELWFKILDAQMETGTPYLLYKVLISRAINEPDTIKAAIFVRLLSTTIDQTYVILQVSVCQCLGTETKRLTKISCVNHKNCYCKSRQGY